MNPANTAEKKASLAMIRMANILFTTDFSPASLAALPHATAVARRYGSKIYLAHVVMPQPYPLVSPEAEAYVDQIAKNSRERLAKLSSSGALKEIPHEALLAHGEVTKVLHKMIKEHDIDLVVAGTHGRRGFRRFFMGSVAEEVYRTSPCPVLTVGPHVSKDVPHQIELHEILYATDLSEESFSAAPYAFSFALEYAARLTVLHVPTTANLASLKLVPKAFSDEIQALIPADAKPWCEPDYLVESGDPAETILKIAKERRAGLIILGIKEAGALASHRIGNVAYRVVTEAECPVLTVRAHSGNKTHSGPGKNQA